LLHKYDNKLDHFIVIKPKKLLNQRTQTRRILQEEPNRNSQRHKYMDSRKNVENRIVPWCEKYERQPLESSKSTQVQTKKSRRSELKWLGCWELSKSSKSKY